MNKLNKLKTAFENHENYSLQEIIQYCKESEDLLTSATGVQEDISTLRRDITDKGVNRLQARALNSIEEEVDDLREETGVEGVSGEPLSLENFNDDRSYKYAIEAFDKLDVAMENTSIVAAILLVVAIAGIIALIYKIFASSKGGQSATKDSIKKAEKSVMKMEGLNELLQKHVESHEKARAYLKEQFENKESKLYKLVSKLPKMAYDAGRYSIYSDRWSDGSPYPESMDVFVSEAGAAYDYMNFIAGAVNGIVSDFAGSYSNYNEDGIRQWTSEKIREFIGKEQALVAKLYRENSRRLKYSTSINDFNKNLDDDWDESIDVGKITLDRFKGLAAFLTEEYLTTPVKVEESVFMGVLVSSQYSNFVTNAKHIHDYVNSLTESDSEVKRGLKEAEDAGKKIESLKGKKDPVVNIFLSMIAALQRKLKRALETVAYLGTIIAKLQSVTKQALETYRAVEETYINALKQ